MMPGMIMLWYGDLGDIPSGWTLCDGTNGTPNLRGQFVRGAWGALAPGSTGGAETHVHNFTGDGHSHDLASGDEIHDTPPEGIHEHHTSTDPASGTTDSGSTLPPYRALAYIMKTPIT